MASDGSHFRTGAHRKLDDFHAAHASKRLPYYEILGIAETASQSEIIKAYRKLSLKLHPDKPGGSNAKFQELSKAYKCLTDPDNRRKYDDCGFDEDNVDTDEVDQFVDAFFGEGARNIDGKSPDWQINSIRNYNRIDLANVPFHMKDIVRIGLKYIVSLDHDFNDVILFQHARIDILYLMVGVLCEGELTQGVFESEESYTITYYDNPLQPGIAPKWSDQNVLGSKKIGNKSVPRRELNGEEFQRRKKIALAMLANEPADPMAALEEKYRAKMLAEQHRAASITATAQMAALRAQDMYEEDVEFDCSAYAKSKQDERGSDFKKVEVTTSPSAPVDRSQYDVGDAEFASLLLMSRMEQCEEVGETSSGGLHNTSVTKLESRGTDQVLGESSDGILFVAKDGQILRNEGPPAPAPTSSFNVIAKEDVEKPSARHFPLSSRIVRVFGCHQMLGCLS